MQKYRLRMSAMLYALAGLAISGKSAAFRVEELSTSRHVDSGVATCQAAEGAAVTDIIVSNGKCVELEVEDIPVGLIEKLSRPVMPPPLGINRYYNNDLGHNGLDVEGKSECLGVNDVVSIDAGRVILSLSEEQAGGWGESVVVATRASKYSEEIITHAYHHMHNHGHKYSPENTTRRVSPCDFVYATQFIGKEGTTGTSSGGHLHLTIRRWRNVAELRDAIANTHKNTVWPLFGKAYPGKDDPWLFRNLDPQGMLFDTFTDVVSGGPYGWAAEYVVHMRHLGAEFGLWDGRYGISERVKRREAARWIKIASMRLSKPSSGEMKFLDVPLSDPDFSYIETLAEPVRPGMLTVINPSPASGRFYPDQEITRAEALKMVILAFFLDEFTAWDNWSSSTDDGLIVFSDVGPEDWYYRFTNFGVYKGIVVEDGSLGGLPKFYPEIPITRAEIAKWIIEGYDILADLPPLPCGMVCPSGQFCPPSTNACIDIPQCVHQENENVECDVGGACADSVCAPGGTKQQACGVGGTQTATCNDQCQWNPWGVCEGQGSCSPSQTAPCGNCGTMICEANGQWGACQNEGVCTTFDTQTQACGNGGTQTRVCGSNCYWNPWSVCQGECVCSSGVCCDGCNYLPSSGNVCDTWNVYQCQGSSPGQDAQYATVAQYCSGQSATCGDGYIDQSLWMTYDNCTSSEVCQMSGGISTCVPSQGQCGAATYWTPTPTSETDYTGLQANGTSSTGVRVEVSEAGTGLQARVCKDGGTFSNNVAFHIYDGADGSGNAQVWSLATAGKSCSDPVNLQNSSGYSQGQQFGGIWQVVSPASSASDWGFPNFGCSVIGSPTGTCWNGVSITATRTCK